jgi:hypothetical protein
MSEQTQEVDLTKERETRCVPIAQAIVKLIGESNPKMGDVPMHELTAEYKEMAKQTIEKLMESNVTVAEINYILQLARQPIEALQSVLTDTFTGHLEKVQVLKLGATLGDIKVLDLHKMLVDDTVK